MDSFAANVALFLIGSAGLLGLWRACRSIVARQQAWRLPWHEARALLAERRRMVVHLAADLPAYRPALLDALNLPPLPPPEGLPTPDCLRAEQKLSGLLLQIARDLEGSEDAPSLLLDCEVQERHLATLRDDYNRHASVWNELRLGVPGGWIARALVPGPLPLWEGA